MSQIRNNTEKSWHLSYIEHFCNCFSLGIDDPITKTAAGSERVYYQQLAKEMFLILDQPIQVLGEKGCNAVLFSL